MPVVELEFDAKGALVGAKEYDVAAKSVGSATDKMVEKNKKGGSSFAAMGTKARKFANSVGPAVLAGMAVATAAVVAFGLAVINAASDMQETQGKFDTVFRGLEDSAESWAANLNKNYLLSKQASKLYLSSIQDLLVPTGMAREAAGEMSNEFVKLAADLASFNNLKTADVVRDFQSALAGGSETLTKYGIDVKVAAVQQEAMALGLIKSKKEMTSSIRAQALLSLALRDSSDALGDVNRTQDSYANQLKLTKVLLDDLMVVLGEKFLPVATKVLVAFNEWISKEENLNKVVNGTISTLKFLHDGVMGIVLVIRGLWVLIVSYANAWVQAWSTMLRPVTWLLEKLGIMETSTMPNLTRQLAKFNAEAIKGWKDQANSVLDISQGFEKLKISTSETAKNTEKLAAAQVKSGAAAAKNATNMNSAINATNQLNLTADLVTRKVSQSTLLIARNAQIARSAAGFGGTVTISGDDSVSYEGDQGNVNWTTGISDAEATQGSGTGEEGGVPDTSVPAAINVNINQQLSRSDVVAILNETTRQAARN